MSQDLIKLTPDVLVVGAGSAGVSAAVAAAQAGAEVLIIEQYGFAGGLATSAQVGTVCGHYIRSYAKRSCEVHHGFPNEFVGRLAAASNSRPMTYKEGLRFLPYDLFAFRLLCDEYLQRPGITTLFHTTLYGATANHRTVESVHALFRDKKLLIKPEAVVDCSGDAVLVAALNQETLPDEARQAGAFVFTVIGYPSDDLENMHFTFLREIARGIQSGTLSKPCEQASIVPGSIGCQLATIKLGLAERSTGDPHQTTRFEFDARQRCREICHYLANNVSEFSNLRVASPGTQVGLRTGTRPKGRTVLTHADILACRKPSNGVAAGAWPMEQWGQERGPKLTFFAEDDVYLVPAGALMAPDLDNLFFAGRHLSADEEAISSARVIGTCLATGWAAGYLATVTQTDEHQRIAVAHIQKSLGIQHWAQAS